MSHAIYCDPHDRCYAGCFLITLLDALDILDTVNLKKRNINGFRNFKGVIICTWFFESWGLLGLSAMQERLKMNPKANQFSKIPPFKTCPVCKAVWKSRDEFLDDPDIWIIGYQVHFKELSEGLFLFNHLCDATMTVRAGVFIDLYGGPMFETRLAGTDECPGFCLVKQELRPCPAKCDCAFAREVIQMIKNWSKVSKYDSW